MPNPDHYTVSLAAIEAVIDHDAGQPGIYGQAVRDTLNALGLINLDSLARVGLFSVREPASPAPDDRPAHETYAGAEDDPVKAWMIDYPGHAHALPADPAPGAGPGWGDAEDLAEGRCCPWCRGILTEHNRRVHAAGYAMGERHTLDGLRTAKAEPVAKSRDPWRHEVPYEVLRLGLHAVASDAVAREDHHTAAYAYSVLAGEPIPPTPDEDDVPAERETIGWRGGACRVRDGADDVWVLHADGWWRADGRVDKYGSLDDLRIARGDLYVVG